MDLKPYYKQIASLLRKASEVVKTEMQEKQNLIPRRENEIKDAQRELKKQEHDIERHAVNTEEAAMKTLLLKQALDTRQNAKDKDREINDVRIALQSDVDSLKSLYDKLTQEASDYETRT